MKKSLIFIISIVSTLLICGFSPQNIVISVAAIIIIAWGRTLVNIKVGPLCAINNPQIHNPELIAQALSSCLSDIKASKKGSQLLISNPGINTLKISSSSSGKMKINDSHRTLKIENGNLWIAEHPLPLILKPGYNQQFNFRLASDGRIHVSTVRKQSHNKLFLLLTPVAAILIFLYFNCVAALLFAPIIHTLLSRRFDGLN